MKYIKGGKIITENNVLENHVLAFDDKIRFIEKEDTVDLKDKEVIEADGNYICPGFISTHIHGCMNCDTEDGSVDGLITISEHLLNTGVTHWCPTLCTVDMPTFEKALSAVREAKRLHKGAEIIGVYLEGIFLSKAKKGAHKEEWLQLPNADLVIKNKDIISLVICAPELEGAEEFIKSVTKAGIRVAVGHSNATYEQTQKAIEAGATDTTHLFNACSPLSHREPGLPAAVLNDKRVYTELICDNFHVHPALYDTVYTLKGDKLIFITDSIRPAGMPDGEYIQGGLHVTKKGAECRLDDGTIAGSMLDLNTGVNNVKNSSNIPLNEIINAVSLNPAKMLGIDGFTGSLQTGKDADLVIADENFNIIKVLKKGK
ncbi:MAG: N-acetylglucosamine-6-phosphate deacetylase [Acutalibacteraceae bacterium]|nr:N-acetylglucosamine-6-phosphate deacetylase [Acutalibacteraceae bacterium]